MSQQPVRVVVEKKRSGCGTALGALLLVGLAIQYWYISVALLAIVGAVVAIQASRRRQAARHRPGPRDPWLNEVVVALADLGFTEAARNTGEQLGGMPIEGDVGLEAKGLKVFVTLFSDGVHARQAETGLRAKPAIRNAIAQGRTAITTAGRVVYVANGRGKTVDEFRLDEVVRTVDRLPLPPPLAAARPSLAQTLPAGNRAAPAAPIMPGGDVLAQLKTLAELHSTGVLTDEEFEAKKADLLGRL